MISRQLPVAELALIVVSHTYRVVDLSVKSSTAEGSSSQVECVVSTLYCIVGPVALLYESRQVHYC